MPVLRSLEQLVQRSRNQPIIPGAIPYAGRRVCVTGGAGFIGSHLTDALVALGAQVSVIDDFSNGDERNLSGVAGGITLVRASILDRDALDRAVDGCAVIFHQAALGSVPASLDDPVRYMRTNADGTLAVLEAARAAGAARIVYAASSSAYGDQPVSPKIESMRPDPLSPYAATKLAGEELVRCYAHCFGLDGISLRYFNIFGPRQRDDSPYAAVIPRFLAALRSGETPTVFGTGTQTRDYTHVANAVWANLLAGAHPDRLEGAVVNVACGHGVSLIELLDAVRLALREIGVSGVTSELHHAEARVGDVMHSTASIDLARERLGYKPLVTLDDGLRELVRNA